MLETTINRGIYTTGSASLRPIPTLASNSLVDLKQLATDFRLLISDPRLLPKSFAF
jgi:hypothetical protein